MPPDLLDLMSAWLGGAEPTPERRAMLLERLRHDPEFRAQFAREARLLGALRVAQAPEPRWLRLLDEIRQPEACPAILEERVREAITAEPRRWVPSWWRPLASAAALLVAVLGALLWRASDTAPQWFRPAGSGSASASGERLAVLVRAESAEPGARPPRLRDHVQPGLLRVPAGRADYAFLNGVELQVFGPAEVNVLALDRIRCLEGRLRVRVPGPATGFTVETPGAFVVDLGTAFGVTVTSDQRTTVEVYDGRVEASLVTGEGGNSTRTRALEAGQAVRLDPVAGTVEDAAAGAWPADEHPAIPALALAPGYADLVASAKPSHYWRCQEAGGGVIRNELAGGPALRLRGGAALHAEGADNFSVVLAAGDPEAGLVVDSAWTPPAKGFALELWFASDSFRMGTLASLTTPAKPFETVALVELTARRPSVPHNPGTLRFLYRWPPGTRDGVHLNPGKLYAPTAWNHLVAQRDGNRLELYLNGRKIGERLLAGDELTTPCLPAFGRRAHGGDRADARGFAGRLDEIALYNRPLRPAEIELHAAQRR